MSRKPLFSVTKKDLDIQYYKSGGPGGQNKNKNATSCRIVHRDSGAVGQCKDHKTQERNKKEAFVRMANSAKFKLWVNRKAREVVKGKTAEQEVEESMHPDNLLVEVRDKDTKKWVKMEDKPST